MSYSDYQRGVQDERFATQLQLQRANRDRDRWAEYSRRQEGQVRDLQQRLAASGARGERQQALIDLLRRRIESLELATAEEGNRAAQLVDLAGQIDSLNAQLEHQAWNCHWLQSVIDDHAIGLRP